MLIIEPKTYTGTQHFKHGDIVQDKVSKEISTIIESTPGNFMVRWAKKLSHYAPSGCMMLMVNSDYSSDMNCIRLVQSIFLITHQFIIKLC